MKILSISNKDLTIDKKNTFLTSDLASANSLLTVQSIVGYATDQPLCIGEIGEESTEIVQTHASTDPTGTTITLSAGTTFDHSRGTKVYLVNWNQVEISWAETKTGAKTVLATIAIQSDQEETIYEDKAKTSGYYWVRFKNSIETTYSDYSDAITYSGYAANTVFSIKKRALDDLGEKIDGEMISDTWLNTTLWEGRRELDNDQSIGKWSFRFKRNANIGSIIPGTYQQSVPSDLRMPNTSENILSLRIGESQYPLQYQDTNRFNVNYAGVKHTTLDGSVVTADTSITLSDSGDFDESGNISVAAVSVITEVDIVAYTANAEETNVISGVTGIQTAGHATGTDVWQNVTFGLPVTYTIDGENKKIEFSVPFGDDYAGENIYMDYYATLPVYDSDSDVLDEPQYDLFVDFLKWRIKYKKSNGTLNPKEDGDFLLWEVKKKNFIDKEQLGQDLHFIV